jgi:hypothetical protein
MTGEHDRSRSDPFAGQPPDTARDYSRAPSDLSTAPQADRVRPLDGQQARYRLAFVAMEVPGLPAVVKIGPVEITQQAGPIWTQHTYIRQRPGWRPHYDKTMHQGYRIYRSEKGCSSPWRSFRSWCRGPSTFKVLWLDGGTKCSLLSACSRHSSTNESRSGNCLRT